MVIDCTVYAPDVLLRSFMSNNRAVGGTEQDPMTCHCYEEEVEPPVYNIGDGTLRQAAPDRK